MTQHSHVLEPRIHRHRTGVGLHWNACSVETRRGIIENDINVHLTYLFISHIYICRVRMHPHL